MSIRDLKMAQAAALGTLLGRTSNLLLAKDHPTIFPDMDAKLEALRQAYLSYSAVRGAYLDALLDETKEVQQ